MSYSWGVKAAMVRVWVAGKTVIPLLHMGHTSALGDKGLIIKHSINSSVYLTLFLVTCRPAGVYLLWYRLLGYWLVLALCLSINCQVSASLLLHNADELNSVYCSHIHSFKTS